MNEARVLDLAIYLGYARAPDLNETDAASLGAARTALVATHPAKLLELMLDLNQSGLMPRRPSSLVRS
jgi:hypothetical protein